MTLHSNRPFISTKTAEIVQNLRQQVGGADAGMIHKSTVVSSGSEAIDRILPHPGFRRGSLVEWFEEQPGSGRETVSLLSARPALNNGGVIVVIDSSSMFYPPAAAAFGIDLERLIIVRTQDSSERHWAWDQALRCPGVAMVWGWLGQLDSRWFRRFQLSAESSGALGFLLRPARMRGRPTWSDLQLQVNARPGRSSRRFQVELVRCRGQGSALVVDLELNELTDELQEFKLRGHETNSLHLATQLAHPKTRRRSTRA